MSKKGKKEPEDIDSFDNPYLDELSEHKSFSLKGLSAIDHTLKDIRYKAYRGLFKDIEISRKEYIFLNLLFIAILSITIIELAIQLELGGLTDLGQNIAGLIPGAVIGVIISAALIDKLKKRVGVIKYLLVIAAITIFIQVTFLRGVVGPLNIVCFIINSFIVMVVMFITQTLFLEYSSILERGRIICFILIEVSVIILILIILVGMGTLLFHPLLYIPLIFIILPVYYIYKNKQLERPPLKGTSIEKRHVNRDVVIFLLLMSFFSFTIGMTAPIGDIQIVLQESWLGEHILLLILITILFMAITTAIVGLIFDFIGRLATLSNIVLAVALASFLSLFEFDIPHINLSIVISSYIAGFIAIPLLIGDITKRNNYGKMLALSFSIFIIGLILGIGLKSQIPQWTSTPQDADLISLGILYLGSVISLVLLVNSKETLPYKEQEWSKSLIHLFVIHESGILLYEYAFEKQEEKLQADLVSGGIIGLVTMLREITKGKEILKTIDHGDKKLMFKYNTKKDVLFVLLIKEDLIVLRKKLDDFSLDFESRFKDLLENISGVRVRDWQTTEELVDKYFKRKYFDFFSIPHT